MGGVGRPVKNPSLDVIALTFRSGPGHWRQALSAGDPGTELTRAHSVKGHPASPDIARTNSPCSEFRTLSVTSDVLAPKSFVDGGDHGREQGHGENPRPCLTRGWVRCGTACQRARKRVLVQHRRVVGRAQGGCQ